MNNDVINSNERRQSLELSDHEASKATGDPKMDAIRGNAISDVKRSSDPTGPRTDLTSVQNIIGPPEYCKHMKEFIARRFFVPTSPQDHDPSELSEVGGQFIETACEPSLNSTPKKPPIHEVMHDIRPTLIKTPEDAKRRNKMTVRFVGNNSTTRNPPKTPSSEASNHHQSGEAINTSLGEAMDALTPSKSCDTNFFASCKSTFISDAHVWNYLDETRVLSLLKRCRRGDRQELRDDLAQKICGMPTSDTDIDFTSYRKVFALLILLEKADQIAQFVDSQIHDNLLPLPFQGTSDAPTAICYPGNYKCHLCFQGWRLIKLKDFVSLQSEFCAPYFKQFNGKGKPYQYQFPTGVALPFLNLNPSEELKKDDPSSRSGGFSVVKKVILPEEHGNLATWNRGNERVFAVKRLHSPLRDDFDSEFHVLARLNKLITKDQPKHLTVLSATFEIGPPNAPTFYFLFPCADGNLKEFWKRNTDDPQRLTKFSQWMASQLYGLAEAVDVLHNFKVWRTGSDQDSRNRGIHGDIKPENILLFGNWSGCQDKFGMLQLSDFGLTRYHNTQTLNQHSVLLAGIHAYCPPEYELIYDTGQALDVWSLGCLFLEFSVWLVFGSEGLEAFQKDRRAPGIENPNFMKTTFYEIQKLKGSTSSEYCLKTTHSKGVIKWIEKVHHHPASTKFLHEFVDLIFEKMLGLEADGTDLPEPGPKRTKPSQNDANNWEQNNQRIKIDKLVPELKRFLTEEDLYFYEPHKYVDTRPLDLPQFVTSTTENEIRARVAEKRRQASMRTCAEAGQADLDARINNNLIPADGTVPNSVKVKQFTEDARKDFKRARRMNE